MPDLSDNEIEFGHTGGRDLRPEEIEWATPTATATPESTLTQRGHASGSAPAALTKPATKKEGPDPYLQLGKHIAEGFRDFIQPSIDLAMRGMALPQQAIQESIQPAAEKVLGSEAGPPMAAAVAGAAAPFTMGIPEGATRVPPAMEALDPELRVQPPARAQQPGPETALTPAPFEGQRAIEGPAGLPAQAQGPRPEPIGEGSTQGPVMGAEYRDALNDLVRRQQEGGHTAGWFDREYNKLAAQFENRGGVVQPIAQPAPIPLPPEAEVVPPNLNPPAVQPRPQPQMRVEPSGDPIPMGQGGPLRAIAGPSRLALPAPEEDFSGFQGEIAAQRQRRADWEAANKPLYEMSEDELDHHIENERTADDRMLRELFGDEGAAKFKRLERSENSSDTARADRASAQKNEMMDSLTREQQAQLTGEGQAGPPNLEEFQAFKDAHQGLDERDPESLGRALRYALPKLGNETDPSRMNMEQQTAYAQLRRANQIIQEKGWDPKTVSNAAIKAAAGRFSDPADAEFMLQRFLKPEPKSATPKQIAGPVNRPNDAIRGQSNVYDMHTNQLEVRPDAFQYKTKADPQGVTGAIESEYDPDAAGFGEAWYDAQGELGKPGQWYVSHGHHRHARATRDEVPTERMILLDSGSAIKQAGLVPAAENVTIKEARARGAIRNFQDEKGTPYDAALYMRDAGITSNAPEWLKQSKIDLSKRNMDVAVGLSRLSPPLWREVGLGRLDDNIASAIGNGLPDRVEEQNALFGAIRNRQQKGRRVTPEWVRARITLGQNAEMVSGAGGSQPGLFGEEAESTMDEQAEILEHTQRELEADRMGLGRAVRQKERLEKAKNVINVQESKALASEAKEKAGQLERTVRSMGQGDTTKQILRRYAAHLKARPGDRKKILDEAYGKMLEALEVDNPTLFNRGEPPDTSQQGMFGAQPPSAPATPLVPSGLRRGQIGDKLGTGEVVATASGRSTTPFPKIGITSPAAATATVKRSNKWLIENAVAEARARGDEFALRQFEAVDPAKASQADRDSAEEYLFGDLADPNQGGMFGAGAGATAAGTAVADHKKKERSDRYRYDPEHPPLISNAIGMAQGIGSGLLKLPEAEKALLPEAEQRVIDDERNTAKAYHAAGVAKDWANVERAADAISKTVDYVPSKIMEAASESVADALTPALGERAAKAMGDAVASVVMFFPDLLTGNPEFMPYYIDGERLVPVTSAPLRYHGTREPLESIKPIENIAGNEENLYGAGLYTTDDLGIAHSYAGKTVPAGVIYRTLPKREIKLLDLDDVDWSGWTGEGHPNSALRNELERRTGKDLNINDYPKDWIGKVGIKNLREAAQDLGYGGFRHVGGKIVGTRPHEVHIYWDPVNDLRVVPYRAARGLKPIREKRVVKRWD